MALTGPNYDQTFGIGLQRTGDWAGYLFAVPRPVARGGSGGSYEPPHEITRSGFLIWIKLLIQIIT